jgi:predicted nucleotidyltransferase
MVDTVDQRTGRIQLRTILYELQAGIRKLYGENAPAILLYGSYARGQAHLDSDVDVLLIYPRDIYPGEEIRRVSTILADLNLRYQVLISILPAMERDYRNSRNSFWDHVRRESISIEEV